MTKPFNLIDEPWIPCLNQQDQQVMFGLRELLAKAHELREIRADTPLETASLYRLLLAILHCKFGPKSLDAWVDMWRKRKQGFDMDELDAYFRKWHHRFDLFDEKHPFFQVFTDWRTEEVPVKSKKTGQPEKTKSETRLYQTRSPTEKGSLNKMIVHVSSGISATLFEQTLDDGREGPILTPAMTARALITIQNYGFGYQKFADAPCSRGIMFLLHGDTLFETLMLNLTKYPVESGALADSDDDKPAWEQNNVMAPLVNKRGFDRDVTINQGKPVYSEFSPLGRLDYLTWHNRKIHLFPEVVNGEVVVKTMAWTPGVRLEDDLTDPMQYWTKGNKTWNPKRFSADRALWRDLEALLRLADTRDEVRPIASIGWIARLAKDDPDLFPRMNRLLAFGVAKSKASPIFMRHEMTPLPIELLRNGELMAQLVKGLKAAERAASAMRRAAFLLAWIYLKPQTDLDSLVKQQQGLNPQSGVLRILRNFLDERLKKSLLDDNKIKDEEGRVAKRSYKLLSSWSIERQYWICLEAHAHQFIQDLPNQADAALESWIEVLRSTARSAFAQASRYLADDRRAFRAQALATQLFDLGIVVALGKSPRAKQAQLDDMAEIDSAELEDLADGDNEATDLVTDDEIEEGGEEE